MKGSCGSHKDVVAAVRRVQVEHTVLLFEVVCDAACLLAWGDAFALGYALDVDAVLVRACQEEGLKPSLPLVAFETVGDDCRVETAQVRLPVDVVDRCRNVESFHSPFF